MTTLGVLTRKTKKGQSTWTFINDNNSYYCQSELGKTIQCESIDELRGLYRKFRNWSFYAVK